MSEEAAATGALQPFRFAGILEPVTYTIQHNGPARGRGICKTILLGVETGRHYCGSPGCGFSAEKWSSVFSHRAAHARAAGKVEPLPQQMAGPAAPVAALANRVAELEALLARERRRSGQLAQRLDVIRKAAVA